MKVSKSLLAVLLVTVLVAAACVPVPAAPVSESRAAGANVDVSKALIVQNYIVDQGTLEVAGATALNGGITVGSALTLGTTGQVIIAATADADTANYDNLLLIEHDLVGLGTKDRVYGIDIEMTRPAGYGTTNGDHDDAGLKIRMNNKAVDNTTGTVMRGVDVNVKNDNPSGAITTLSGATFTVQTDTGSPPAGNVSTAYAVQGQITANAPITDSLVVADFRNFRQTATEPVIEYGVQIRNGNTTGTGIDRGLSFASEAATVGNFGYIIDMNDAAATTADIRLSQGETIDNLTDGTVAIGGALSATGLLTANGGIAVDSTAFTVADGTGNTVISGTLAANGGITVDSTNFTVHGTTGAVASAAGISALNATIGGGFGAAGCTLGADGAVSCDGAAILGSTLNITGATTLVGDLIPTQIKPSGSGSAAANNYCMSADCDTGLWYPGDNIIGLATAGVERARVTNSGLSVTGDVAATTGTFAGNVTITETLIFEGATDDGIETIVTVTDPTSSDKTITLPNYTGTVLLSSTANEPDTANAVWANTGDLKWEGSAADGNETTLTVVNPNAARTITLPNASGTVALITGTTTLAVGSDTITGTVTVTHTLTTPLFAFCTLAADSAATGSTCTTVISGATVTVKVWKPDGTTAGDAGLLVNWLVAGTP